MIPPHALLAVLLVTLASPASAQVGATVTGRIHQDGSPVVGASVLAEGTSAGSLTDRDGGYRLAGLAPGRLRIRVEAIGYSTAERVIEVVAGESVRMDFELAPSPVAIDPIVVTGTMKQSTVSQSIVKVEVVPAAILQRVATNNIMQSIQNVNGLYQQVDCGVCYTNSIRINGMEGPYTAVLIDGMPIMSSLASVYGLNGINPSIIERIEIVKGPSSTLYGTEAMGGVVNVITKSPRFAPLLALEGYRTSLGEENVDFAGALGAGQVSGLFSGSVSSLDTFNDANDDGFSDAPLSTRAALFAKVEARRADRRLLALTGKYYRENRAGGVEGWTEAHRGSASVYGESVDTRRYELIGSLLLPWASEGLRFDFSATHHEQDSFYGATPYRAEQKILFGNLIWDGRIGERNDLLLGATLRHQLYDDDTPATNERERRYIPGVLAQNEWAATDDLSLLGGFRVDHHTEHGFIGSPRVSLKWAPLEHTALRLNAGTGFRVVNLFSEDHAALTGARQVIIAEELEPERSYSLAFNLNQVIEMGPSPMMIDFDAFHTRFSNRIIPDYDTDPNQIIYANLRGHSTSRGIALSLNQNVGFERLLYNLGVTLQQVYSVEDGVRTVELFAPEQTAVAGLTYNHPNPALTLAYTARLVGPMRLPAYAPPFERPTRSETYSVHDAQVTLRLGDRVQVYGAAMNLLDFVQGTPLVDAANPFGEAFDTSYVWGPIQGRSFLLGARMGIPR